MVREILKKLIKESLVKLQKQNVLPDFLVPEVEIEQPADKKNGDYSTNIAMKIAKIVKKPPLEIADAIVSAIKINDSKILGRALAVEPGFIDFFLSEEFLQNQLTEIFKKDFGKLNIGKGKKVNIEFISANPTGPLHIGNGRGAFFGDVLANVLEKAGYEVFREYFVNDAKKSNQIRELGKTARGKGIAYLNDYLRLKIKKQKQKIQSIIKKAKNGENIDGKIGYLIAKEIQKDNKNFIEKKLKIKFDNWFFEQEQLFESGEIEKTLKRLKDKDLTYEKEGAVWLKTSEFGDGKDWVIVRSDGEPSYFLSDIAYHKNKIERGFDKIIDIWGADHQGHIRKMQAAMKILGYKKEFDILISQLVRLKSGKMSKRKGEIVALEDLLKEVGLDIARFFYLTKSLNSQMEFDLDLAKEQSEKNPVYYIQYAYARIASILRKAENNFQFLSLSPYGRPLFLRDISVPAGHLCPFGTSPEGRPKGDRRETAGRRDISRRETIFNFQSISNFQLLNHQSELKLIKQLIRFPEIVEEIAKDYQVQRLPQYAMDLATSFHQFYRDCQVLTENSDLREVRLILIFAAKKVLKSALDLMGISAPEKM